MKSDHIGFMQGRLSPIINGKIQAFPWSAWESEFSRAHQIGIKNMEWTLDDERLSENPFNTSTGQAAIRNLSRQYQLKIPSVTGDCFMQAPFFKSEGAEKRRRLEVIQKVIESCQALGVQKIVFPLVDQSSIQSIQEEEEVVSELKKFSPLLKSAGVQIVFESDFAPQKVESFIEQFDQQDFGINYDIGNSASLGFDPREEFECYGHRIRHIHVKDRLLGGTTVPLGQGSADFSLVFLLLKKMNYQGYYILQTARANEEKGEQHSDVLKKYFHQTLNYLES